MADDLPQKPPGRRCDEGNPVPDEVPGRIASDDRGNMTWEWANDEVLQADDTAGAIYRLRALVDPSLGVLDDGAAGRTKVDGYNPYDSGLLAKADREKKRKLSLRELSQWIETKRKLEGDDEPSGQ